jgi:ribosomal-protein-alanine N-acetyltransferase
VWGGHSCPPLLTSVPGLFFGRAALKANSKPKAKAADKSVRPTRGHRRRDYNEPVEFALRDFRQEEIETLWRIDQQCFAPGISYSRLELATYLQRPGAFSLVADGSGGQIGFIVAEAGSRATGHIITIDVLPHARGAGIGSRLLRVAEDRLRAADCRSVILETAVDNTAALSFYKRHHYTVVKTLPRYYSNGVDALVLKKDLLSPPEPANLPQ